MKCEKRFDKKKGNLSHVFLRNDFHFGKTVNKNKPVPRRLHRLLEMTGFLLFQIMLSFGENSDPAEGIRSGSHRDREPRIDSFLFAETV